MQNPPGRNLLHVQSPASINGLRADQSVDRIELQTDRVGLHRPVRIPPPFFSFCISLAENHTHPVIWANTAHLSLSHNLTTSTNNQLNKPRYLIHAPYGGAAARNGTWLALVEAQRAGRIRSIGVSNYGLHHLDELEAYIKDLEDRYGKGQGGQISVGQWYVMLFFQKKSP